MYEFLNRSKTFIVMNLFELRPNYGSVHSSKRLGRGQGSGKGGTSTRGHKGAKSRSGYSRKLGFEGGQMPLQRRLPKFGMKTSAGKNVAIVHLHDIQRACEESLLSSLTITPDDLFRVGLIKSRSYVKVLFDKEITIAMTLSSHGISFKAKRALESCKGSFQLI